MTPYELAFLAANPFLPVLIGKVRGDLLRCCRSCDTRPLLLDVGGRKSPYTVGVPAQVTISDIPREGEVRTRLGLGFTTAILDELRKQRSNIDNCIVDDMVNSTLPSEHFDIICCVEVIEHVREDQAFVRQLDRVLKPGGFLLMTTPNGDYIRNEPPDFNPDHVRHYTRDALVTLLTNQFGSADVEVAWAVKTGAFRAKGLRGSFDFRRPLEMLKTMACNVVSHLESRNLEQSPRRRAHLIAKVRKAITDSGTASKPPYLIT